MAARAAIGLKRVYEPWSVGDGCRVLVERLWPRGVSRERARIDLWAREAAPSAELRRWFGHAPARWDEFRRRYHAELSERPAALQPIVEQLQRGTVTFVFAAREPRYNNAVALKEYIERTSST